MKTLEFKEGNAFKGAILAAMCLLTILNSSDLCREKIVKPVLTEALSPFQNVYDINQFVQGGQKSLNFKNGSQK